MGLGMPSLRVWLEGKKDDAPHHLGVVCQLVLGQVFSDHILHRLEQMTNEGCGSSNIRPVGTQSVRKC